MEQLTPEEKQRIEEEEQKRFAEEQYRAEVRARLETTASDPTHTTEKEIPQRPKRRLLFPLLLVLCFLGVFTWLFVRESRPKADPSKAQSAAASNAPRIRRIPVNQKIATGQIVVKAGSYVQYRIRISPEMRDASIKGSFNVSGGAGNDIEAVLVDEGEFLNWINGHQARGYYGTNGRKTTDRFDVPLGPGNYILAFSNKFSLLSHKYVFVEVDLNYTRLETY